VGPVPFRFPQFHLTSDKRKAGTKLDKGSAGLAADPLSLFLSLRHSPDERVRQQLARLIDQIVW